MDPVLFVSFLGAIAAALATYVVAARRFSGKVSGTEASRLWDASERMRADYAERVKELYVVINRCEERVLALEQRNDRLVTENDNLHRLINDQREMIADLEREVRAAKLAAKRLEGP